MDLLGVELAGLTSLDELSGIMERCGLIKSPAKSLPDEGARQGVMATLPSMDVL
jgi:hypothetical protein